MPSIGPYSLTKKLKTEGGLALWRGHDVYRSVLALVACEDNLPPLERGRLEHEYALREELDPEWSVRPTALVLLEGRPVLVFEDAEGELLERHVGQPMELRRFLHVAVALAEALGKVHAQGLIHKDFKPANVFIDPQGRVRLTGFGLASRVPREYQAPVPVDIIAGTLAYMAPEQTGRMNRSVDSRSDLYALGVVYYQFLTGVLPFAADEPLEWIHCHLARQPQPPLVRHPGVEPALSDIVMKLLSKVAEDRYQTAAGVVADLERCVAELERTGAIAPFPLGTRDASGRLLIPEKLYGREREQQAVAAAFDRVAAGGPAEMLLVSGYSGVGKSALVYEINRMGMPNPGIFVAGKFDRHKRDVPYFTLAQAFKVQIQQILSVSEERVDHWRTAIRQAVGTNGRLLVDLIPELEILIGPQPPVPELASKEAQNRFQAVFRQFIGVFAKPEHPLVLFLDDLQWLDQSSLWFLEHLMTQSGARHLLLIGAYRDNEVHASHPLMLTLESMSRQGATVNDLVLAPLPLACLNQLISDALHCRPTHSMPLAKLVFEKTAGNPFFAIQFLGALHEEGLLAFDAKSASWKWNIEHIRAKGLTDNVVGLVVAKLQRLPQGTQEALKRCACLGHQVPLATLALVLQRSVTQTVADIEEALRAGLLMRQGGTVKFIHDKVHEAAYALIPEAERPPLHLAIGRSMLAGRRQKAAEDGIFDIVNQLNQGSSLVTDANEMQTLCRLNFQAGKKAKASAAWASACSYLAQAVTLCAHDAWDTRYDETFDLYLELSECEYLIGAFESADEFFRLLQEKARSNFDRSRVCRLQARLFQVAGRYKEAIDTGLEGLALFGVVFPTDEAQMQAEVDLYQRQIVEQLQGRDIAQLAQAPVASDASVRALIGLLADTTPSAYVARPKLYPLLVMKGVMLSLRHGNIEESCATYSGYSILAGGRFKDVPTAIAFSEMAIDLNERFNDARLHGRLLHIHGNFVHHRRKSLASSLPIIEQGFVECIEVGNLIYAAFCGIMCTWAHIEKGDTLDAVVRVACKYIDFAQESRNGVMRSTVRLMAQLAACLKGATQGPGRFDDADFSEAAHLEEMTKARFESGICYYHAAKQVAAYLYEQYPQALEAAVETEKRLACVMSTVTEVTHYFYYALTLTALYPQADAQEQARCKAILQSQLEKLAAWAADAPENYGNRHALVAAEVARIEGRHFEALRLYEDAARQAHDNGFVQNEALANELAARFCREQGFDTLARTYLRNARDAYQRWGAAGKVSQLDERWGEAFPLAEESARAFEGRAEDLDLMTVVKAAQAMSGELGLERLTETLLRIAAQHAGAERVLLVLEQGNNRVATQAETRHDQIVVTLRDEPVTADMLPMTVLQYVLRTRGKVLLAHASAVASPFRADEHICRRKSKSILCVPLVKQAKVMGALYLENNAVPGAFTADRVAVLDLLAAQAAIALENASLYSDLQRHRDHLEELVKERTNDLNQTVTELELVLENASTGIMLVVPQDGGYRFQRVNRAGGQMLGYDPKDLIGRDTQLLYGIDKAYSPIAEIYTESLELGQSYRGEQVWRSKDGSELLFEVVASALDRNDLQRGSIWLFEDITERSEAEERMRYLALYDPLTGLPNRVMLRDRLNQALAMARRRDELVTVLFVDLDGFKAVNDQGGHDVGDYVLQETGRRLKKLLRASDTVARWGGDEFVIMLSPSATDEGAHVVARELTRIVAVPIACQGRDYRVGASIGIGIYPDHALDADRLLEAADEAMYRAKRGGKGCYEMAVALAPDPQPSRTAAAEADALSKG